MDEARNHQRTRHRRIELNESARWQVSAIGAVGGLVLVVIGLRPTGSAAVDVVLLAAAGAFVAWCGCTAPWWLLMVAGIASVAVNPIGIGTALGLSVITTAAWVGLQRRSKPLARAGIVAVWMVSFGFVGDLFRFGVSAVVGIGIALAIAIAGLSRRPRVDRRFARRVAIGTAAFAVFCTVLAGLAAYRSLQQLRSGNRQARAGLAAMRTTDFGEAATQFNLAATSFDQASSTLSNPLAQPARLIPVVAQQWNAAHVVTDAAVDVSFDVATNADKVDLDALKVEGGAIDIAAIRALEEPLADVQLALDDLDTALVEADSPWLAPQFAERLDALSDDVEEQQRLGDNAVEALKVAPGLLGADDERRYFVMFTTPAEARGQGGFMGNYAELSVSDGKITIDHIGRHTDLNLAIQQPAALRDAPAEWLQAWGNYGFQNQPDGRVSDRAWSIIGLSGHFPNTGGAVADLYTKSGGEQLDGVFSIDVYALQALVGLVGPIQVPNGPALNGENTAEYLLLDQYRNLSDEDLAESNASRIDGLEVIATEVSTRLLDTNPPTPLALGRALAPFVGEHRIAGWAAKPEEQAMFETIDLDGRVLDSGDITVDGVERSAIKMVANNSGGSKIDSFLGVATSTAGDRVTIQLTNTAPTAGLPNYVIGSSRGELPLGTSRLLVSLYATDEISNLAVNGAPRTVAAQREGDNYLYVFQVEIPSGATSTITLTAADDNPLIVEEPPPGRRPTPTPSSAGEQGSAAVSPTPTTVLASSSPAAPVTSPPAPPTSG